MIDAVAYFALAAVAARAADSDSAVAERAAAFGFALIDVQPALAAVVAGRAVLSGLAVIFFDPILAAALVFVAVAFLPDPACAPPAFLAVPRPLC